MNRKVQNINFDLIVSTDTEVNAQIDDPDEHIAGQLFRPGKTVSVSVAHNDLDKHDHTQQSQQNAGHCVDRVQKFVIFLCHSNTTFLQ